MTANEQRKEKRIIMDERITLDHGNGGQLSAELIERHILKAFPADALHELRDGAIVPAGTQPLVMSTDSFVVSPWRFPGGDIGKLAVCGTVNDLLMSGGIPAYLTFSLILEEGFAIADLDAVLASAADCAARCGVSIVTGDTKVVEKGKGDQIYINTAGVGFLKKKTDYAYQPGDQVILSGSVGRHGAAVFMAREDIRLQGELRSDCAPLCEEARAAMETEGLRIMRDPTRGGLATTCTELVEHTKWGMELDERAIPVDADVQALCDLLGFDPLYLACEGRMIAIVSQAHSAQLLEKLGKDARIIGTISDDHPGTVLMKTRLGTTRWLRKLSGQPLPRIC